MTSPEARTTCKQHNKRKLVTKPTLLQPKDTMLTMLLDLQP